MQSPLLDHWKALPIDKYDGTTDPDEHIDIFLTQVTLNTTDDAALFCYRPHQLTSLSLVNIRQDKKESLRAFMDLFNKAALEIRNLNAAVALHHLTTALKPGPFVNSICKKNPVDMDDLRRRADKYMQMEELANFRNQARAEPVSKAEKVAEQPFRGRNKELTLRELPARNPKYSHYTPLNASRATVLEQALASEVLAVPKRALTPPRDDTNKSCRYHRNRGHSTEECAALKDRIDDLIKQGQLQNFVDRPNSSRHQPAYQSQNWDRHERSNRHRRERSNRHRRERSRSRDRKEEPQMSHRCVINTIVGGFAGGGSTSSAQKRHLRVVRSVNVVEK
ncbi:uncharacterized protein LOC109814565 [Cajanus cajan]|uniref:uncharacterized protein LOC109814565 n=1 Tax=Cajanus cajan TaxID=3821 RepID=UPI00098DCAF4|nr:uncharacterized protein LOC109814565 [Cajanus cajan]